MDVDEGDTPLDRWEQRVELPLFYASLVFLAAYSVRILAHDVDVVWREIALATMLLMWFVFAADFVVRLRLSGQRLPRFLRTRWLDAVVLLLPLLRPLRLVKLYTTLQRRRDQPVLDLYVRVIVYAGLSAVLLGWAGALAVYHQERTAPGATILTFGDAVWWVCATLTTVGYGDVTPVTAWGRTVAVGLMICGLALLGAVTGSFSSWLIQVFAREDERRPPGDARPPGASS
ncbi:two pore domain potassium channel family protein [Streptomyces sp. PKU-MA01144]|uniref:potassium channel family protein n=1 Tax=Streptomyces TaxID=1883 RepID=UPI00147B744D|nr:MULTISPECIES: potassium channel family protein [Streptomyces]MCY0979750.1 potassium channel family protein [Streptomyces tirandamycinicus]NNJ07669.1 two pore domain potassium channel family protein [Streptomyces sp. PKU-MA01144]